MTENQPFFNIVEEDGFKYYVIPENTRLFRGDIPEDFENPLSNIKGPVFFGDNVETALTYGLPFEFEPIKEIKVLALDKSMETIYNEANPVIQSILKNNYGYPNGYRNSDDKADKELTKYICETYGGYALDYMPTEAEGKFHREIVLCDKKQVEFVRKVPISEAEENTIIDNQKLRRAEQNRLEQKKRPRRDWSMDNSDNIPTTVFGIDDNNLNRSSTTKSTRVNRSLFDQEDDEMDKEDNKSSSFAVNKLSFDEDDDEMEEENKGTSSSSVKILFEDDKMDEEEIPGGKRQQHKKKTMRRNKKNSKKRSYRRKTNKRLTRRNNSKRHTKKNNKRTHRK